jgi:CHAT domain
MSRNLLHLTVQARRSERFGKSPHEEGEIHYAFYGDGSFLGKSAVDVNTKRALLARFVDLTNGAGAAGWNQDRYSQLVTIGKQLFTLTIPEQVRHQVFGEGETTTISLEVQDHDIPWELLHDDQGFVARRLAIGRRLVSPSGQAKPGRHAIRVVIVGDPTGDLEGARIESSAIGKRCKAALAGLSDAYEIASEVILLQRGDATKDAVLLDLLMDSTQMIDVFHFAGHAHADPLNPDDSGFTLADGDLRAFEARSLASRPLVFANGCRAGQANDSSLTLGAMSGFAGEFIAGGAQAYIAPAWPIGDDLAREFASTFYDSVIGGETIGNALLAAKRALDDPDALAYLFFGDVTERLGLFSPELTSGPYVNDLGIQRIIETEREYSALELLAVNDLPWILWDTTDILAWTSRLPIDELRRGAVAMSLMKYVQEFGEKIRSGEKRFLCVLNAKMLRRYLDTRGPDRWQGMSEELETYFHLDNFTLLLASPLTDEIDEIELVSNSQKIPPEPAKSVYVFNKQTRFEQSYLTYNLFEDYNPQMISRYWERLADLVTRSLAEYRCADEQISSPTFSQTVNGETRAKLRALAEEVFGSTSKAAG